MFSENVKQSNEIDIYLTSIVIGKKSTNQIAQYMVEIWRSFHTLFTSVERRRGHSEDLQMILGVFTHC